MSEPSAHSGLYKMGRNWIARGNWLIEKFQAGGFYRGRFRFIGLWGSHGAVVKGQKLYISRLLRI